MHRQGAEQTAFMQQWDRDRGLNAGAQGPCLGVTFVLIVVLQHWRALFNQGAEDLSGIQMLWTNPTRRQLQVALHYAFVAPWGPLWLAQAVLGGALIGILVLASRNWRALAILTLTFGPYFVFDVLFQETFTTGWSSVCGQPVFLQVNSGFCWHMSSASIP